MTFGYALNRQVKITEIGTCTKIALSSRQNISIADQSSGMSSIAL